MSKQSSVLAHLEEHGPTCVTELSRRTWTAAERQHGVTTFTVSKLGGRASNGHTQRSVAYLFGIHDPADVIRAWCEANAEVVEHTDQRALVTRLGNHGRPWREAARTVFSPDEGDAVEVS